MRKHATRCQRDRNPSGTLTIKAERLAVEFGNSVEVGAARDLLFLFDSSVTWSAFLQTNDFWGRFGFSFTEKKKKKFPLHTIHFHG